MSVATLALVLGVATPVSAQSLPQYRVEAEIRAVGGGLPAPGGLVKIDLNYLDPATGKPAPGKVWPIAFMRTIREGNDDCATAVRAYSLNKGMYKNASSLSGSLVVTANVDGTLSFVDPLSNFKSANIFEVVQLPGKADLILPFAGEVAAVLKDRGMIISVDASGQIRTLARDQKDIVAIAVAGPVLLTVTGKTVAGFGTDGDQLFRFDAATDVASVSVLDNAQSGENPVSRVAVLDESGSLTVIGSLDGALSERQPVLPRVSHISGNGSALIASGDGTTINLVLTSSGKTVEIELGFQPSGVLADGLGRYGVVWSGDGKDVVLIDLVAGTIVDRFALPGPPAEALFAGRSLFFNHSDNANITLVDTATITGGSGKAAIRTYVVEALGTATPMSVHDVDAGWIIALPPGLSAANVYGNGNPTAPMTTTPLRGSLPHAIMMLDRTFRQMAPGRLTATGRLPLNGPVQLVTMTGDFKTIRCFDIESSAPLPPLEAELAIASGFEAVAGQPFSARLAIKQLPAGEENMPTALNVIIRDAYGNRAERIAKRISDGTYQFDMTIRVPGQYPITAEDNGFLKPVFLIVEESR